jgi:hypothetical protein
MLPAIWISLTCTGLESCSSVAVRLLLQAAECSPSSTSSSCSLGVRVAVRVFLSGSKRLKVWSVFNCPCSFGPSICSWLCELRLASAGVRCAIPPLVLLCSSIRWRAAPLPVFLLLLRISSPALLFRAYFALGGDLGQRPEIFRRKIYGSHSPPLAAVFGPSNCFFGVHLEVHAEWRRNNHGLGWPILWCSTWPCPRHRLLEGPCTWHRLLEGWAYLHDIIAVLSCGVEC